MKAVLFDMFGVLARVQSPHSQAVIERTAGVSGKCFWEAYWSLRPPYDRGHVMGPAYWKSVGERIGTPFTGRQIHDLIAADLAGWSEVDEESVDFLAELDGRGLRLGLLSNIPEELAAHYEATHEWLGRFSVLGLSCRIGSAKPDPAAYEWCIRELGLPAEEILFVDDRSDNVLAAREVGLRGHLFTGVAALAEALREANTS
ncbi:HAD family phosphatase [Streptomyces sp. NPDC020362]|uniref:HAD family hydrolase n=1 Tax=unclassified Streptomyces TaxID=2593676 RepID=UPI000A48A3F7